MSNNKEVSEVKESNVVAFEASLILDDVHISKVLKKVAYLIT